MVMIEGEKVRGTQTCIGFIPHLELFGMRMPIQVEHCGPLSYTKLPKPRVYGTSSVWALPGGLSYVHREPVKVVR